MSRLFDILHLKFPAPQINSQKCSLEETAGEQKTGLPAWSGWANRSFVVSETLSGGEQRLRCWGDDNAPKGEYPEGVPPSGRFFGDFLIGEKVTRVQGVAPALEGSRNCPSAKNPFFWPCLFFLVKTFLCNKERVG